MPNVRSAVHGSTGRTGRTNGAVRNKAGSVVRHNVTSAIRNTVSISRFNRGLAGKVFEEVRQNGTMVVMKNNAAECVLLSPEEYVRLMDELEDAYLLGIAEERLAHYDPSKNISQEELDAELGITEEDLAGWEDVELD